MLTHQQSQKKVSPHRPLPQQNQQRNRAGLMQNADRKTSVRLPSLKNNNKWVEMARAMEGRGKEDVIEEQIEAEDKEEKEKGEEEVIP